jgi:amidohydrolase family protein/IPT/TIG domain-containing protein
MKKSIVLPLAFFVAVFCAIAVHVAAQAQQPALVIEGGTLIDGNGGAPVSDAVVIIQGNKITSVSRKGQGSYPAGAQVIKADGKFILPGLWDAQVVYQWYFGEMMLNHGITSTIDVANPGEIAVPLRDAIVHGKLRGPRPFTGVTRLMHAAPGNTGLESLLTPPRVPKSAQDARDFVKDVVASGADFVILQDGSMPLEYYQAAFDEANKAHKPVFTRAYGPIFGPKEAAMLGSRNLPHSAGIGTVVTKTPGESRNELDLYADMDDAKAKDLIQLLIQHKTSVTPTFNILYPGYARDWARFEEDDRKTLSDANLLAYYPQDRVAVQLGVYSRGAQGAVRERRMKGFQNTLRFHKMFVDAGGHLVPGANTNATRVPGDNLFHEMDTFIEAGISPMQIIQGATKWSAEMIDKQNELGTVEAGKLADVIVVNKDPLQNIDNLRDLNTVIFDGKVAELGYHPWYASAFPMGTGTNSPVDALSWAAAYHKVLFGDVPEEGEGGGGPAMTAAGLRDPVESPQPAIETISPTMITEDSKTATVTLKGYNFVRRSQVYFKGTSVPYKVVSPTELQVTLDAGLLREPGWFDLVVKNPWPLAAAAKPWGDGTSNQAHLIVNYKY